MRQLCCSHILTVVDLMRVEWSHILKLEILNNSHREKVGGGGGGSRKSNLEGHFLCSVFIITKAVNGNFGVFNR